MKNTIGLEHPTGKRLDNVDCLPPRLAVSTKGGGRAEDFPKERDLERAALAKKEGRA